MKFRFKKVGYTFSKNEGPDTSFFAIYEMHLISAKVQLYVHKDLEFVFQSVSGYLDQCLLNHSMFIHIFCLTILSGLVTEFPPTCRPSKQCISLLLKYFGFHQWMCFSFFSKIYANVGIALSKYSV